MVEAAKAAWRAKEQGVASANRQRGSSRYERARRTGETAPGGRKKGMAPIGVQPLAPDASHRGVTESVVPSQTTVPPPPAAPPAAPPVAASPAAAIMEAAKAAWYAKQETSPAAAVLETANRLDGPRHDPFLRGYGGMPAAELEASSSAGAHAVEGEPEAVATAPKEGELHKWLWLHRKNLRAR